MIVPSLISDADASWEVKLSPRMYIGLTPIVRYWHEKMHSPLQKNVVDKIHRLCRLFFLQCEASVFQYIRLN